MRLRFVLAAASSAVALFASPADGQAPQPEIIATQTQAGTKGKIEVDTTPGYARLLLTYQRPTSVSASIADGVLTLRLGNGIDTTVDALVQQLNGYVSSGRRDADGLTYRFAIARTLALHNSSVLAKTAIDLIPDSFKGVPPELPPPPPPPKPAPPNVTELKPLKVGVAERANFTRLMFDWPQAAPYTVYPGQGRFSVRFEGLVRPDFSVLQQRKPAWVKNAGWRIEGMTTVVEFETDPESQVHDFREGERVGIDVLAPKTDAAAYRAESEVADAMPDAILPLSAPAPAKGNPPPKGSDAAAALAEKAKPVEPEAKPVATPPASPRTAAAPPLVPAQRRDPSVEITRDGSIIHFPQAKGRGVAVFVRGETTWIVLADHPAIDAASVLTPLTNAVAKAESSEVSGAAILKLVFKTPLAASVSESQLALNVALTSGGASAPSAITLTRSGSDGQTMLTTPLAGATRVITITDPDAGDKILIAPAHPGKGMLTPKRFVEFESLPSSAGLAIVPFAEDVTLQVRDETATVGRPEGLALSSSSGATAEPIVQAQVSKEGPGFIDFSQWGHGPSEMVYDSERALRAAVARLPESESTRGRLQLARYLLAHDLGAEAIGEIGVIQNADAGLASDPALTGMKGAAQVMMGRYGEARNTLSMDRLASDPHAALWRGIAEAKLGDYGNARRDLLLARPVLFMYPNHWQTRARLARAETGLAQGDLASANDALDQLPVEMSPRDSVESRLYAAQLLAAQGHVNEAVSRLRGLEMTDYAPVAAKATYARVDTLLGVNKIKSSEAIDSLEKLRFRWRGDDLELKTLRKLGSLYFADNRWREGLTTLRIAAVHFPGAEGARDAQDDMRRAFSDLFLGSKGDSIPAVQALALFSDFTELTPIGRDGDEMIRKLTDRLVEVDLLGPAEQLLDHQVNQRLNGVARAAVATKLALIYLLDHKFDDALKILSTTRQTRLPDEIMEQRRILEARALAGLKRFDAATDLIVSDDSRDAKRLRADIYWDSANWNMAGDRLEELLGERWTMAEPLTPEERDYVMRAAVAYSLGNEQAKLDTLSAHYAEKMKTSPDDKAFAVVTERIDRQGIAFRDLAKQIASVDTLKAFMDDFKARGGAVPAQTAASN